MPPNRWKTGRDPDGQLDLALLLSVAANRIEPTLEARVSLWGALMETERIRQFVHTTGGSVSLAVSPNGRTIATGDLRGGVVLRDSETLEVRASLQHGKGFINSVSFSPDGTMLASGGPGRIVLWDALSGREHRALDGSDRDGRHLVWHPDSSKLFSGSINEPGILVWDIAGGRPQPLMQPHERGLRTLAVSPDGNTIASSGEWEPGIKLSDVGTRKERMTLHGHEGRVRAIAFSADGTLLASGGEDSMIVVWDLPSGTRACRTERTQRPRGIGRIQS